MPGWTDYQTLDDGRVRLVDDQGGEFFAVPTPSVQQVTAEIDARSIPLPGLARPQQAWRIALVATAASVVGEGDAEGQLIANALFADGAAAAVDRRIQHGPDAERPTSQQPVKESFQLVILL